MNHMNRALLRAERLRRHRELQAIESPKDYVIRKEIERLECMNRAERIILSIYLVVVIALVVAGWLS